MFSYFDDVFLPPVRRFPSVLCCMQRPTNTHRCKDMDFPLVNSAIATRGYHLSDMELPTARRRVSSQKRSNVRDAADDDDDDNNDRARALCETQKCRGKTGMMIIKSEIGRPNVSRYRSTPHNYKRLQMRSFSPLCSCVCDNLFIHSQLVSRGILHFSATTARL